MLLHFFKTKNFYKNEKKTKKKQTWFFISKAEGISGFALLRMVSRLQAAVISHLSLAEGLLRTKVRAPSEMKTGDPVPSRKSGTVTSPAPPPPSQNGGSKISPCTAILC